MLTSGDDYFFNYDSKQLNLAWQLKSCTVVCFMQFFSIA